jgi:hypothetical protein
MVAMVKVKSKCGKFMANFSPVIAKLDQSMTGPTLAMSMNSIATVSLRRPSH